MDDDSFGSVIAAAQTGADWAISTLYRSFNPALVRFFAAQAGGDADDLAQETWIGAGRTLRSFEGDEGAFRSWLFTIARRVLIAHWRGKGRRPSVPVDPMSLRDIAGSHDPTAGVGAAEAAAALVAGLPAAHAEIVLLRVVGGLDAEDVAVIVGKSPGAVRVIQHRALRRIAARLAKETRKDL